MEMKNCCHLMVIVTLLTHLLLLSSTLRQACFKGEVFGFISKYATVVTVRPRAYGQVHTLVYQQSIVLQYDLYLSIHRPLCV